MAARKTSSSSAKGKRKEGKSAVGAELLERIAADPDDVASYLVYADMLTTSGDPRGELIVLMHQLSERPDDAHLGSALDAYMTKHRTKLFGSLARHAGIAWDFHLGFLRSVRYVPDLSDDVHAVLKEIFQLPTAALLRDCLVFADNGFERETAAAVSKWKPRTLPRLRFAKRHPSVESALRDGKDGKGALWLEINTSDAATLASVARLENLEHLEISTTLTALPKELATLRRLRRLDIDFCYLLEVFPPEIFGIETLGYISMYDCRGLGLHMGRVNNLVSGFVRAKTPSRRRIFEAMLMTGGVDRLVAARAKDPDGLRADLLAALDNNVEVVRQAALRGLLRLLPDPFEKTPAVDGKVFALTGKVSFDKKRLGAQLGELGASLTSKVDPEKTTHVIVGESPGGKQSAIGDGKVIVLESHLLRLLSGARSKDAGATKKVKPTASADGDRIKAWLSTRDEKDVMGAIALLKEQATIAPELFVYLLVVWQDVALEKSRDEAKKLLAIHAPVTLNEAAKTHLRSSLLLDGLGETKRADRITTFCSAAKVIDGVELAELLALRAKVGLKYLFANAPSPRIVRVLQAITSKENNQRTLDLSTKELGDDDVPEELAKLTDLERLDLSSNHLTQFPAILLSMKALRHLDLSGNRVTRVPDDAPKKLPALESFSLGFNRLRSFPKPVLAMKNLEELCLGNSQDYVENEAQITGLPSDIGQLQNLRLFDYSFNLLPALPAELFTLKKLEELRLFQCSLPKTIPDGLTKLPKLRRLDVAYSTWASRRSELKKLLPRCVIEA